MTQLTASLRSLRPRTRAVFDVLYLHLGEIVSKKVLIDSVWKNTAVVDDNLVQCIAEIRRAIATSSDLQLKTFARRGYMLSFSGREFSTTLNDTAIPRIVVSAFACHDNPTAASFSQGLYEDIVTEMVRHKEFKVVSAEAMNVHYLLEGSVQCDTNLLRTNIRLLDKRTGAYVWTKRYDTHNTNLFERQVELAAVIVNRLGGGAGIIVSNERKRLGADRLIDPKAYEYYLLGSDVREYFSPDGSSQAIQYLRHAVDLDPSFSKAWARLAILHLIRLAYTYERDTDTAAEALVKAALTSVELDPGDSFAQAVAGGAFYAIGDSRKGAAAFERALASGLNNADALATVAYIRPTKLPTAQIDYQNIARAMRLNPYYPEWYSLAFGYCGFYAGMYQEAIDELLSVGDGMLDKHLYLTLCHAELGNREQCRRERALVLDLQPEFSVERLIAGDSIIEPAALDALRRAVEKASL